MLELTDFWSRMFLLGLGVKQGKVNALQAPQTYTHKARPELDEPPPRKEHWARRLAGDFKQKLRGGE